jgi:hypothetical protein
MSYGNSDRVRYLVESPFIYVFMECRPIVVCCVYLLAVGGVRVGNGVNAVDAGIVPGL